MAEASEALDDQTWPLMAATLASAVRQRAGKRKQLAEAALGIKDQLQSGEILHAWMLTHLERDRKSKPEPILLVLTDRRIFYRSLATSAGGLKEWPIDDVLHIEIERKTLTKAGALICSTPDGERTFRGVDPPYETVRAVALLEDGHLDPAPAANKQLPVHSLHPAIARLDDVRLFPDRISWQDKKDRQQAPLGRYINARAITVGGVQMERGRDMASKAWGTAFFGPAGLLLAGNAKARTVADTRGAALWVRGGGWQIYRQYPPKDLDEIDAFVEAIHIAISLLPDTGESQPTAATGDDPLDQIAKLGQLRQQGLLTETEFDQQKKRILNAL